MKPLVSIIIPAFNAEKYVRETIESVLAQTYANIELIVVDDGSTDTTGDIARSFGSRVIYIRQEKKGPSAARNAGIHASHGEYVVFLDADDMYLPEKIEKQVAFLQSHPQFQIVYCHMYHYYEGTSEVLYRHQWPCPSGDVFGKLFNGFFGQADTLLVPRYVLDKAGLFDEEFKSAEDWEMNLRMAHAGYKFGFMNEPLIKMRISPSSWGSLRNQIENKIFEVKLFEKVSTYITPEEKLTYPLEKSLMNSKLRLAVAYLTQGKKREALQQLYDVHFTSLRQVLVWKLRVLVYILPVSLLTFLSTKFVLANRKHILKRVN